jgi:hypothetical protein
MGTNWTKAPKVVHFKIMLGPKHRIKIWQYTMPASSTPKNQQLSADYTTEPAVVLAKASVAVPKPPSTVQTPGHLEGANNQIRRSVG